MAQRTKEEILAEIIEIDARINPRGEEYGRGEHVSRVWEDGEHTSEKGGTLLGMRNLHCFNAGRAVEEMRVFLLENLPHKIGDHMGRTFHAHAWIGDSTTANRLSEEINAWGK